MKSLLSITIVCACMMAEAQPAYPTTPAEAQVIYSDLDNFLTAFNLLEADSDSIAVLNENYFSKASPGLIEYIGRHGLTPEKLAKALGRNPDQYALLPDFRKKIKSFIKRYSKNLLTFHDVVPNAMYPPTYLIVGSNRGIAQASPKGQLVTIERAIDSPEELLHLMLHELTHFQQALTLGFQNYIKTYSQTNNMLDLVLREGGAEFVSYYLVEKGKRPYRNKKYFEANEADLKARFITDLENQEQSYWMWESLSESNKHTLLGYTIGYKICEAYYLNAEDKNQALFDILGISNAQSFLQESGYFTKN
ncbi:hypothetical protein SAMN05421640_2758 [Ekhidna lutea]|uniref:Uncharacterized protein n=1 Tax=Ekhidna lutea TaxID=447679 RepID=A0A239KL51_EKHLU|nr:DUF2268 domain-containing putative Zn-dependent protease [Ekhidna lutea]SNT19086.1 hypothetical protein SAMN05421640_2758 [Ekhidna lutea]